MMRRWSVWRGLGLLGLCLLVGNLSVSTQAEAERGVDGNDASELPAEVRAAIAQVQDLHRSRKGDELTPEDQRLHALERTTRRLQVLLLDAIERDDDSERADTVATIEAEWAKWQRLRREHGSRAGERSGERAARRTAQITQRLESLERAIAREVNAAGSLNRAVDRDRRELARRDLRARLVRGPPSIAQRFPPSMLGVVVSAPAEEGAAATTEAATAEAASIEKALERAAEGQRVLTLPEYKALLGERGIDYSTDDPTPTGRSFLSPEAAPIQTGEGTP